MPLDEAAEVVRNAGRYGRVHTDAAFAGYLGHKTPNSGPFRGKMASLRDFGLIERPKDGQVPLTDLGHQIAHPTGDDQELLQKAFFAAKSFEAIYEESAKGTELSLELISNRAVTALGVSAPNKQRFAESFRRSVVAAGLGRDGGDGRIILIPPGKDIPSGEPSKPVENELIPGPESANSSSMSTLASGIVQAPTASRTPTIYQEWPVPGGRVVFEVLVDGPLPGSAFGGIAAVMEAVEKFVGSIQAPAVGGVAQSIKRDENDGASE